MICVLRAINRKSTSFFRFAFVRVAVVDIIRLRHTSTLMRQRVNAQLQRCNVVFPTKRETGRARAIGGQVFFVCLARY